MNPIEEILALVLATPESQRLELLKRCRGECKPATSILTFSITEAGKRVGVSRQTIYNAIRAGVLRADPLYPGGRQRIRQADLQAWIGSSKVRVSKH